MSIRTPPANCIFVFGSNLAGRHGKGAALYARQHFGAQYGVGQGHTGCAYAIPTKDRKLNVLPLEVIDHQIAKFTAFAMQHKDWMFYITRIGCGLAGFMDYQIAPLFHPMPRNCIFDTLWRPFVHYIPEEEWS